MKYSLGFFVFLVSQAAVADISYKKETVSAIDIYKDESKEYVKSLAEASNLIRKWRQKRLGELFDQKLTNLENKLTLSNLNLIEEYNKFKKEKGFDILNDSLLLRLAHLYFEGANLSFNKKMKDHQALMASYQNGRTKSSPEMPVPDYANAIFYSKKILTDFPSSPLADRAYYLIGYCYDEMGNYEKAIQVFERLVNSYPYSVFSEEVMWRIAEHEYNSQNYLNAKYFYSKLTQTSGSYKIKSIYKLGATYFSTKEYDKSYKTFKILITFVSNNSDISTEDMTIFDEALSYMGVLKTHDVAIELEPKHMLRMYQLLGENYKNRYDDKSMRVVYLEALEKYPLSGYSPFFYSEIINSFESDGAYAQANKVRDQFLTLVTKDNQWWDKNEYVRESVFKTEELLEEHLLKSARYFASDGIRTNSSGLIQTAKTRYEKFIKNYSYSPYIDNAMMEQADLSYETSSFDRAAELYLRVIHHTKSDQVKEKAAYSYVWTKVKKANYNPSYSERFEINEQTDNPVALSAKEKVFEDATQIYLENVSGGIRRQKLLMKLAEIYAQKAELAKSEDALLKLVADRNNSSMISLKALGFLESLYNIKGEWPKITEVRELASTLRLKANFTDIDKILTTQFKGTDLESIFDIESSGQLDHAIPKYKTYLAQYPNTKIQDHINLKIAILYHELHDYKNSQEYLNKLVKSRFASEALFVTAQNYKSLAQFEKSADYFEKFLKQKKHHVWAEEALTTAYNLRRLLKQENKAFAILNEYVGRSKSHYRGFDLLDSALSIAKYSYVDSYVKTYDKKDFNNWMYAYSFLVRSYLKQDDVAQVERYCTAIPQIEQQIKKQTAYFKYSKSWCEYYKIKSSIAKESTTVPLLQKDLNVLRVLNVPEVLSLTLSEIALNQSDKKVSATLATEAWKYAKDTPYSDTGASAEYAFAKSTGKLPLHMGLLINWRLPLTEIAELQTPPAKDLPWDGIKSACDNYRFDICLKGLESIYKAEPSPEILKNLVLAYVKVGDDQKALEYLQKYATKQSWDSDAVELSYILGVSNLVPEKVKRVDVPKQGDRTMAFVAQAEMHDINKKFQDSVQSLQNAIEENSQSPLAYGVLAKKLFEKGYYKLSAATLEEGVVNSSNMGGIFALRAQVESALRRYARLGYTEESFDWNYLTASGVGMIALKNNDKNWIAKTQESLANYKYWNDIYEFSSNLYHNSASQQSNSNEHLANGQLIWLNYLAKADSSSSSVTQDQMNSMQSLGYSNPMLAKIKSLTVNREVSSEKNEH